MRVTAFISCIWVLCCAMISHADTPILRLSQSEILPLEPLNISVEFCPQEPISQNGDAFGIAVLWNEAGSSNSYSLSYDQFSRPIVALDEDTGKRCLYLHIQKCADLLHLAKSDFLSKAGIYEFKARVLLPDGTKVESEIQRLVVSETTGADKDALNYIQKGKEVARAFCYSSVLADFLNQQSINAPETAEQGEIRWSRRLALLKMIIQKFPTSKYAEWANVGIALIEEMRVISPVLSGKEISKSDIAAYEAPKNKLELIAKQAISPVSAAAWFEAGLLATLQRQQVEASASFKQAIEKDKTLKARLFFLREQLSYVFYEENLSVNPVKDSDPFDKKLDQIERLGYSIDKIFEDFPAKRKEYQLAKANLIQRRNKREIDRMQYYNLLSQVLDRVVAEVVRPKLDQ